ncbi:hypothetical protein [Alloprevotella tannerae]|uniref:Uncharacterized protein n=1 Tax=Alloprevotella tannerae ATCC 51259 TaxID=626522 RepID=C9LH65_9BACT|nr:hypothetical protein [Alloprevotella tannerae]EEX72023.1 hypothetical protein GCWU000325_01566 [Alloprevotella tannerae ATCC 51259]
MTENEKRKQSRKKLQEQRAATQRFLADRLDFLETIRDIVNAELDRRKDEYTSHAEETTKRLPAKRCKFCQWLDELWE